MQLQKTEIRKEMKQKKALLSASQKQEESVLIWKRLEQLPLFQAAQRILFFHSLDDEPYTHDKIREWSTQKKLFFPVVQGEHLEVRPYSADCFFSTGTFGIQEPLSIPINDLSIIDIAIIPGVAFDTENNRLGRGKGYYDRLFQRSDFRAYRIGVCFSVQQIESLPTEPHDRKMSAVIVGGK